LPPQVLPRPETRGDAEKLAELAQNPIANLISVPFWRRSPTVPGRTVAFDAERMCE
jgi:hypothetical protein